MWQDEITTIVRYMIGDYDSGSYTDSRLQTSIIIASRYVNAECFSNAFTITLTGSGAISPDPTDTPRNESFINLVALKTACLLGTSEAKLAGGQGIAIKDGSSSLDLRGVSQSKSEMMKSYCEAYESAKMDYKVNGDGTTAAGEAVLGPIRRYCNG